MFSSCGHLAGEATATDDVQSRQYADLATAARVNCIRLTLALCVGFVLHMQILEAVVECEGVVHEEALIQVIFLHSRLQGLLYAEEMAVVNKALAVHCDVFVPCHGQPRAVRAEFGRVRFPEEELRKRIGIFGGEGADCGERVAPSSLPKVLLVMLMRALRVPMDRPWGYPQRLLNVFAESYRAAADSLTMIELCWPMLMPLGYMQVRWLLIFAFAFLHPFSMDAGEGTLENVVMPFWVVWGITSVTVLTEQIQEPLGMDHTDMDLMANLHGMEVAASCAFDAFEQRRSTLNCTFARTVASLGSTPPPSSHPEMPSRRFQDFFRWAPTPTPQLSLSLRTHGPVEAVNIVQLGEDTGLITSTRKLLRRVFKRGKSAENLPEYEAPTQCPSFWSAVLGFSETQIWSDSQLSAYYLVCRDVAQDNTGATASKATDLPEQPRRGACQHAEWTAHAFAMLQGHAAASLVGVQMQDDTERSVLELHTFADGAQPLISSAAP
eukprot:NODE_4443_length_1891_cov_6.002834.p1 GENE.NODE_4443_length_1891_cov_6.002834~~NODE_4443_length_1891_cov_6.002834.p1  ORF type:complete len:577 (+),score=153.32 NODE_4443_length_1891_cov_6.002834:249-1733(+)